MLRSVLLASMFRTHVWWIYHVRVSFWLLQIADVVGLVSGLQTHNHHDEQNISSSSVVANRDRTWCRERLVWNGEGRSVLQNCRVNLVSVFSHSAGLASHLFRCPPCESWRSTVHCQRGARWTVQFSVAVPLPTHVMLGLQSWDVPFLRLLWTPKRTGSAWLRCFSRSKVPGLLSVHP